MSNDKSPRPVFYATNRQKTTIHNLKRKKGLDDDAYRATIYSFTHGRTDSSKYMYKYEAAELIQKWLDPEGKMRSGRKSRRKLLETSMGCHSVSVFLTRDTAVTILMKLR